MPLTTQWRSLCYLLPSYSWGKRGSERAVCSHIQSQAPQGDGLSPALTGSPDSICFAYVGADRLLLLEPSCPITTTSDISIGVNKQRSLASWLRELHSSLHGLIWTFEKAFMSLNCSSIRTCNTYIGISLTFGDLSVFERPLLRFPKHWEG